MSRLASKINYEDIALFGYSFFIQSVDFRSGRMLSCGRASSRFPRCAQSRVSTVSLFSAGIATLHSNQLISFNKASYLVLSPIFNGVFSGIDFADFWMENDEKLNVEDYSVETIENKFYGEEIS
jgi:hypothetical protein